MRDNSTSIFLQTNAFRLLVQRGWRTQSVRRRRTLGACGHHYLVIWEITSLNTSFLLL